MPTSAPTTATDDLWSAICLAADRAQEKKKAPSRPKADAGTAKAEQADSDAERALIQALCGGMVQWTNDAQVFILHHWHCQCCGAEGTFPNLDPRGRLVRRHNRVGTSWICHDPSDDAQGDAIALLPREFQHQHHAVGWCHSCVQETNHPQISFVAFLPPTHISPGSATRIRPYV